MKLALALLALSTAYASAELPDAPFSSSAIDPVMLAVSSAVKPKPHHDYAGWSLLAADSALRISDAAGTISSQRTHVNHEAVLPDFIAKRPATMYAYSASVVAFDWYLAHELQQHGHRKLARLPYIIDIGVEVPTVHNFTLSTRRKP